MNLATPIYFTSDEHHDHYKLMAYYEKRPFETVDEMTKSLISNYGETVPSGSIVYHLGDFSMVGKSRINYYESLAKKYGKLRHERHLILGNHDDLKPFTYVKIDLFSSVHTAFWMPYHEYNIIMAHDPAIWTAVQNKVNSVFLHGHIHSLYRTLPGRPIFNVGVDVNKYRPISLDEIIDTLKEEGSL